MSAELENQTQTTMDTETKIEQTTEVTNQEESKTSEINKPSLEEVISLLATAGNENLMQLAPVKELIQSARKQEKDKLYKSLEQKENEAKDFQQKLTEAQDALKKYEVDNLSFEEKMKLELDKVREEQQALVQSLQAEKEKAEQEARKNHLEAYKAEKLRLAGDELILELVGGTTEEEIDQSIEKAKAKYQEIASKFEAQAKAKTTQDVKDTFTASAPSSSNVQPLTREEISRMSAEEYAKNRSRIMEAMRLGIID
jgi:hypothetical protein